MEIKCVFHRISRASLAVLFFNKNRHRKEEMEVFGAIWSTNQRQQALNAISANSPPPAGKQLLYLAVRYGIETGQRLLILSGIGNTTNPTTVHDIGKILLRTAK